ncbi:MAG: ribosome maturation factor RimM [Candidatus Adiutrix sp.]|jgi:16S rRNA processing protein RimM|nr:ribosome maturation factor RimM [Candidatus Adiutrix sp.]
MTEPELGSAGVFVVLGQVARPHGVHGALVVVVHTENPAAVLESSELELRSPDGLNRRRVEGLTGRATAQGLIIKIRNITTREAAAGLKGWQLVTPRDALPPLSDDEVYWADLLGLAVFTPQGQALGRVEHLVEAGGGLLLAVPDPAEAGRERLLPFHEQFLVELNPLAGRLVLDLPPGLLEL